MFQWSFPLSQIKVLACTVSLGGYIYIEIMQDDTVVVDADVELIDICQVCRAESRRSMHCLPVNNTDIQKV